MQSQRAAATPKAKVGKDTPNAGSLSPILTHWLLGSLLTGIAFIVAGILHFIFPATYLKIMPPQLPGPEALIAISGAAEIAGGIGLMIPSLRRAAAWGLIALLIAVFPANIYMAWAHVHFPGIAGESWAQWARLPLQLVMIWWVKRCAR